MLHQESSAEVAAMSSPGREAGVGVGRRMSAEGAAQNSFERLTGFAGGH
jgi:hypothetical protein